MFDTLVRPQARNSLSVEQMLNDDSEYNDFENVDDSPNLEALPKDILAAIRKICPSAPNTAEFKARATHGGVSFTIRGIHEGNSGIVRQGSKHPFSIETIVQYPKNTMPEGLRGPLLLIRRHQIAGVSNDPYLEYPLLRASIWGTGYDDELVALPLSQVDGHFAKCVVSWERRKVAVIVLLSREHELDNDAM